MQFVLWLTKFGGFEQIIPLLRFLIALRVQNLSFIHFFKKIIIPEQENNIFDSTIKLLFPRSKLSDVTLKIETLTFE